MDVVVDLGGETTEVISVPGSDDSRKFFTGANALGGSLCATLLLSHPCRYDAYSLLFIGFAEVISQDSLFDIL